MKPCDPNRSNPAHCSRFAPVRKLALAGLLLAGIAPLAGAQSMTLYPRYRFKMMLGGPDYTHGDGACTVIDDFGRIATDVMIGGIHSLVRTDGTTTELIADTSGPIESFEHTHAYMQMNSSGTVAFLANMVDGGQAIFTWDGSTLRSVMDLASLPWPSHTATNFIDVSINAAGMVAGLAMRPGAPIAIFLNDGATTSLVVEGHYASSFDYFGPGYLRLLDDGTIATVAYGSMFPRELRCDPPFWTERGIVRLSPFGGILETLASTLNDDTIVDNTSFFWSSNNSGDVIYRGGCSPNATTMVGASASGQFVLAKMGSTGDWDGIGGGASISNTGRIAFVGAHGGEAIVADGPDPVRNRVLGTGDVIFGKTVAYPELRIRDAINDAGQICMYVTFTDGTDAIVRADPRPLRRR